MKWPFLFLTVLVSTVVMTQADTENPYAVIVSRNAFGLIPIPTNPPVDVVPETPPPKITPNGIMDIFGKLQALFKVAEPAKGNVAAHDESYVLSEGEQQDEIEVVKINKKDGVITFNNHGKPQELPLIVGVASGGAVGAGGSGPATAGAVSAGGQAAGIFGNRFGRNPNLVRGNQSNIANPNETASPNVGGQSSGLGVNNNLPPEEANLSPEAQVLMIEKNRIDTQDLVDKGLYPPLPATPLTPSDATAHDGTPLIAPTETPPVRK